MERIEFLKKCQPYNKRYYELFNTVPVAMEYIATYEEYLEALKKCVEENVKIETLLEKIEKTTEVDAKL